MHGSVDHQAPPASSAGGAPSPPAMAKSARTDVCDMTVENMMDSSLLTARKICYPRAMSRSTRHATPMPRILRLRRLVLALMAFVYLFSAVAHHMVCTHDETQSVATISLSGSGDGPGKSELLPCEHCASCSSAIVSTSVSSIGRLPNVEVRLPQMAMPVAHHAEPDPPPPKAVA